MFTRFCWFTSTLESHLKSMNNSGQTQDVMRFTHEDLEFLLTQRTCEGCSTEGMGKPVASRDPSADRDNAVGASETGVSGEKYWIHWGPLSRARETVKWPESRKPFVNSLGWRACHTCSRVPCAVEQVRTWTSPWAKTRNPR